MKIFKAFVWSFFENLIGQCNVQWVTSFWQMLHLSNTSVASLLLLLLKKQQTSQFFGTWQSGRESDVKTIFSTFSMHQGNFLWQTLHVNLQWQVPSQSRQFLHFSLSTYFQVAFFSTFAHAWHSTLDFLVYRSFRQIWSFVQTPFPILAFHSSLEEKQLAKKNGSRKTVVPPLPNNDLFVSLNFSHLVQLVVFFPFTLVAVVVVYTIFFFYWLHVTKHLLEKTKGICNWNQQSRQDLLWWWLHPIVCNWNRRF